ncbi:MAG: extracellular solute-binding protein [Spirochaetaceae bacterium]|nr:extracellular solute-binding protein [Spirochaetaceae bacterium]
MKKIPVFMLGVFLVLIPAVVMAGGGQSKTGSGGERNIGASGPYGKYTQAITLSTTRIMDSTIKFDPSNSDMRSWEENRLSKAFEQELGVKFTYKWIATDTDSNLAKWNAAIATGDIPDFAMVTDNVYKLLYEADLIADMGQIFKDYASPELVAMLPENFYDQMTIDGKMLGIPLPNKGYHSGTVLWIRKDWLDRLSLSIPKTIDDVIAVARAFKKGNLGGPDTIGIIFSNNNHGGPTIEYGDGKWSGFVNGFGAYLNYWIVKNGKLEFSEVQPEMRTALLAMQGLYKEGLINRDFAVANAQVAQEYFSSGKAGLVYSTTWMTHSTMMSLHANDPKADIINIFPPSQPGKTFPVQSNSPTARRIFISKFCKNPEAVVKLANLNLKWQRDNFSYYIEDSNNQYFKYLPWGDYLTPVDADMKVGAAIRDAVEGSGKLDPRAITLYPGIEGFYTQWQAARDGDALTWFIIKLWGPGGSITTLNDAYDKKLILDNAFNGLPTDTMSLKGDLINSALEAVMFDVVAGTDISVWDRAVRQWYANGGTQITNEVNEWYRNTKK